MPIDGFPDKQRHKLCIRCRRWHEPHEGKLIFPDQPGPFGRLRRTACMLAEDESAMRFMCLRCLRVRRYTKAIIFATFALLVLLALLLKFLGVGHHPN